MLWCKHWIIEYFIAASCYKIRLSVETGGTILRLNLRIMSSNFHTEMQMICFHQLIEILC